MQSNLLRVSNSEAIEHRLGVYSLTAVAATVSVLALSQPAGAEVVVTKKTIPLLAGRNVFLDVNNDGTSDFKFEPTSFFSTTIGGEFLGHQTLVMKALTGGKAVGRQEHAKGPYASALVRGAHVGPSVHFSSSLGLITIERAVNCSCSQQADYGNWSYYAGSNRFLGVKFQIKGETHFGWIRLKKTVAPGGIPPAITGYAYETIANKAITTGATSESADVVEAEQKTLAPSLGMLAHGADGLALWRREYESRPAPALTSNVR